MKSDTLVTSNPPLKESSVSSETSRWHRVIRWIAERLYALLPDECGLLARTGDVYCTLPEGHDGPHGWEIAR